VPLGPSLSSPTPFSTPRVYLWVNPKRLDEEVRDGKRNNKGIEGEEQGLREEGPAKWANGIFY
jgi:hypothetical protein